MKVVVLGVVLILLVGVTPLAAQPPSGPPDLAGLKADLDRIQADLEDIKRQLGELFRLMGQRQGPTQPVGPVRASIADAPTLGKADARVTLVEFSDYQCPFCARFAQATLPALKRLYIDTGKVRYVFRDFPLDQIHPEARKAAEAAHCAGDQDRYWEMHDRLFQNQRALAVAELQEHARQLGLDGAAFDDCLASSRHAARVAKGLADGTAAGVQGTPGFVVAVTKPGDVAEGTPVRGAQPLEVFRQLIERLLADQ